MFCRVACSLNLALDRVETADDDERNFIIFSDSKSALQAIPVQDCKHPLVLYILERLHWLVQYQEKRILFYWIPIHVGIRGNEKTDAAAKAGLLRRVTNVPIPYDDFKKHQCPFKAQKAVSVGCGCEQQTT